MSTTVRRRAEGMRRLLRGLRPQSWLGEARCEPGDWARLDAVINGHPSMEEMRIRTAAARELCARCPVRQHCADDADEQFTIGVCGGSLRYEATTLGKAYVALPLIPEAATSRYDWPLVAEKFDTTRFDAGRAASAPELQERRDAAERAPLLLTNAG